MTESNWQGFGSNIHFLRAPRPNPRHSAITQTREDGSLIVNTPQGPVNSSPEVPVIEVGVQVTEVFKGIDSVKDDTSTLEEPTLDFGIGEITKIVHVVHVTLGSYHVTLTVDQTPEKEEAE